MNLRDSLNLGYEENMVGDVLHYIEVYDSYLPAAIDKIADKYIEKYFEDLCDFALQIEEYILEGLEEGNEINSILGMFQTGQFLYNQYVLYENIDLIRKRIAEDIIKEEKLDITLDDISHIFKEFEDHNDADYFLDDILKETGGK